MNGPEHYQEAERCIELAKEVDFNHAAFLHREALVHATLAQAAATIATSNTHVIDAWYDVLAVKRDKEGFEPASFDTIHEAT